MLVVYRGHTPSFLYEFNGKRYLFTNKQNPVDMPAEALRHLYLSRTPNSLDILPVEGEGVAKIEQENLSLKKEVAELNQIIQDLERRVKNGRKK